MANFYDDYSSSNHAIVNQNNVTQDTSNYVFGGGSGFFSGGSSNYLTSADSSDWRLGSGTGNFTIDFRLYITADTTAISPDYSSLSLVNQYLDDNTYWSLHYIQGDTHSLEFQYRESGGILIDVIRANSFTASSGTWYHIALVRNSNSFQFYVNGSASGLPTSDSDSISDFSGTLQIGHGGKLGGVTVVSVPDLKGNLDELRFSTVARWTTDFTIPTTEYSTDGNTSLLIHFNTIGGRPINFYSRPPTVDAYTALYLPFDGLDGSTTFTDISGRHTVTPVNDVSIDTAQSVFGGASGLFKKATKDYLTIPDSEDWHIGTNNFTFETWAMYSSFSQNLDLFFRQSGAEGEQLFQLQNFGSRAAFAWHLPFGNSSITWDLPTMNVNQWYNFFLVKEGTIIRLYLDNVLLTSSIGYDATQLEGITGIMYIGAYDNNNNYWHDGWFDNMIWSNIARTPGGQPVNFYSRGIDPVASSVLYLHMDGTNGSTNFIDSSPYAHTMTANSSAQISTAQFYSGGGSGLFTVPRDYVSTPNASEFTLGTVDFSLGAKIYITDDATSSPVDQFIPIMNHGEVIDPGGGNTSWVLYYGKESGQPIGFSFYYSTDATVVDGNHGFRSNGSISLNSWHSIDIIRTSGIMKMYVDDIDVGGARTFNSSTDSITSSTRSVVAGGWTQTTNAKPVGTAWIDEAYIIKGTAVGKPVSFYSVP